MVDMTDLNKILERRSVPEMRGDLVNRIVVTARPELFGCEIPREEEQRRGWLGYLLDGILLPRPALVLSLFLLAGVLVGSYTDASMLSAQEEVDVVAYLSISDEDGYGDWL